MLGPLGSAVAMFGFCVKLKKAAVLPDLSIFFSMLKIFYNQIPHSQPHATVPDFYGKVNALERPEERSPTGVDFGRVCLDKIADGRDYLILDVHIGQLETNEVLKWLEESFVEVEEGVLGGVLVGDSGFFFYESQTLVDGNMQAKMHKEQF